jgi:spore coat protein U-like protein
MKRNFMIARPATTLAILLALAPLARAGTATSTFNVTASVTNACTVSGTNLDFGSYDPTSPTANDAVSTISVLCTLDDAYTIGLNEGLHGASVSNRKMSDGASHSINYSLYSDSGRTNNWGNSGSGTVASIGTGLTQSFTVYGRIPASQNVPQGSYSDTITMTVDF